MNPKRMENKIIKGYDDNHNLIEGKVILVYTDLMASGTNEYQPLTMLLVVDSNGNALKVKPRNVMTIKHYENKSILIPNETQEQV